MKALQQNFKAEISLWTKELYQMRRKRESKWKGYAIRDCDWNDDIKGMEESKIYQERVKKAFSKDSQIDEDEMKLRDSFFTDLVWCDDLQDYKRIQVPDFEGKL